MTYFPLVSDQGNIFAAMMEPELNGLCDVLCVAFPCRDVVLGVPVVSLLLALRPRRRGTPHVGHAAAPQEGPPHHSGAGQRGLPGFAVRERHHQ